MIFHAFNPFRRRHDTAQQMIAEHSRWLTQAIASPRQPPRIPRVKMSQGGFARMMASVNGRYRAERWWDRMLQQLED